MKDVIARLRRDIEALETIPGSEKEIRQCRKAIKILEATMDDDPGGTSGGPGSDEPPRPPVPPPGP